MIDTIFAKIGVLAITIGAGLGLGTLIGYVVKEIIDIHDIVKKAKGEKE